MDKPDYAKDLEYKFDPDNLWFTADTHFGHANILHFSNRLFKDVQEMDETIISRWNEAVPEDGIIFHLGDFCFGGSSAWNDVDDMAGDPDEFPGWYQIFGHTQQELDPVIGKHFACLDCRMSFRLTDEGEICFYSFSET